MIILFSKSSCKKCIWLKESADLTGIKIYDLTVLNPETLALLAFHECVSLAETSLPILVLDDSSVIAGAINIKNYLLTYKKHNKLRR